MIGNDIVDLDAARQESNWNRPRFLDKVFAKDEQCYLDTTPDKAVAVWLLWSMKESAYKIISRYEQRRFFAPKQMVTSQVSSGDTFGYDLVIGQVNYGDYTLYTKSTITDSYIHTIAQSNIKEEPLAINCFCIDHDSYKSQHQVTQQHLLDEYAALTDSTVENLAIRKDATKVPHLYQHNEKQMVMITTSHHGHYGSYVLKSISA